MHDRPPTDDRKRDRRREQDRERKRRQRQREQDGGRFYRICVSPVGIEAIIAQSKDAKMTTEAAERASRDRKKVAADLADVIEQWAVRYLAERDRA